MVDDLIITEICEVCGNISLIHKAVFVNIRLVRVYFLSACRVKFKVNIFVHKPLAIL